MSHSIKQKHQLSVTYLWANYRQVTLHSTVIPTSCHIPLSQLPTCHVSLNKSTNSLSHTIKQTIDISRFIKQEYHLAITYHQANYRHVTLNNTENYRSFKIYQTGISTTSNTPLNRNIYELPHAIKETTDLSHFI
jgi:hypothetical protein